MTRLERIVIGYSLATEPLESEYPCVVIPVMTQHYILLQRNNRTVKRYTNLGERLRDLRQPGVGREFAI